MILLIHLSYVKLTSWNMGVEEVVSWSQGDVSILTVEEEFEVLDYEG